jgi:hypothetical protein
MLCLSVLVAAPAFAAPQRARARARCAQGSWHARLAARLLQRRRRSALKEASMGRGVRPWILALLPDHTTREPPPLLFARLMCG